MSTGYEARPSSALPESAVHRGQKHEVQNDETEFFRVHEENPSRPWMQRLHRIAGDPAFPQCTGHFYFILYYEDRACRISSRISFAS